MTEDKVIKAAKKLGKEVEIISTRKVGQYAPGKYRVCCDFVVR
jgi:tRNA G37 N-methylase Trm5